jgi:hypothetical protein
MARHGMSWKGKAWKGMAWYDKERHGKGKVAWHGMRNLIYDFEIIEEIFDL